MRLNFYVTFDNVYDIIDPLLDGVSTRITWPVNQKARPVWSFVHLKNMKMYPGRNLNQSLQQTGEFPAEFVNSAFIEDNSRPEVNFILRLLSSNVNFNQLSMRATFNNCPAGSRFFLIKSADMSSTYNHYIDLYNATNDNPAAVAKKSRLFGAETYTPSDIREAIDGAYNRAEHFFNTSGTNALGHFTAHTYQTNQVDEVSDLICQLLIKE